jgi:hypothetical protein
VPGAIAVDLALTGWLVFAVDRACPLGPKAVDCACANAPLVISAVDVAFGPTAPGKPPAPLVALSFLGLAPFSRDLRARPSNAFSVPTILAR